MRAPSTDRPAETNALGVVELADNSGSTPRESFVEPSLGSESAAPDSTSVGYSYVMQLIRVTAPLWLVDLVMIVVASATGLIVAMLSGICLLYTSPSPRDRTRSRMPSSA